MVDSCLHEQDTTASEQDVVTLVPVGWFEISARMLTQIP